MASLPRPNVKFWITKRKCMFYLREWHPRLPVTIARPVAGAAGSCWPEGYGNIPRPRPGCRRSRGRAAPAPRRIRRACLGLVAPTPRDSPPPAPCARYAARPIAWRVSFRGIPATPNTPKISWPDLKLSISISPVRPSSFIVFARARTRTHTHTHTYSHLYRRGSLRLSAPYADCSALALVYCSILLKAWNSQFAALQCIGFI